MTWDSGDIVAINTYSPFYVVVLFNTMTVLSFLFIIALIATAYFSKYVRRSRLWYGLFIQWIIYCISYMLLFGFQKEKQPPLGLCLLQASLIYACPPACAVASACFMVDFYMTLGPLHNNPTRKTKGLQLVLILLPWLTLLATSMQVILFTTVGKNVDIVQRSQSAFFCNITDQEPTIVSVSLVLVAAIVLLVFEIKSGIIMYRNRQEFMKINYKTSLKFLSVYIRSTILTIGVFIATALSIYSLLGPSEEESMWSVSLPFMPVFVGIVLGSQEDLLRVWVFWKKRKSDSSTDETLSQFSSRFSLTLVTESTNQLSKKPSQEIVELQEHDLA